MNMKYIRSDDNYVDVSHGLGIPFGGIGTGYCAFGKYGFVKVNFNSIPDPETMQYNGRGPKEACNYLDEPANKAPFALFLSEGERVYALQETPVSWRPEARPVDRTAAYAFLPKGEFVFEKAGWDLAVSLAGFSPMVPHDLANSTIPVQVYTLTVANTSDRPRKITLHLGHRETLRAAGKKALFEEPAGQVAFMIEGGRADGSGVQVDLELAASEEKTVRFFISWYYPKFNTPSTTLTDTFQRYYTRSFSDAAGIIDYAEKAADGWSRAIDEWHSSFEVPSYFKRLWFSSLCSVICSTMLSDDPYFFEIETPHRHVDTMDVNVYSSWLYLINWPEIERMEMNQFFKTIPTEGPQTGLVWHSLWNDAAHYVEEPIFLTRVYRDYLWFNDPAWLNKSFPLAVLAANNVYGTGNYQYLIKSTHGNQSYDAWKMPGVSAFVNSAWIYGLYSLDKMSKILNRPAEVAGLPIAEMKDKAVTSFDKILWNGRMKYWNCFYRTPDAEKISVPESAFTDQLFGKWAVGIDPEAETVLPADKVKLALETLYQYNLIDDREAGFRGWVNGLLPGRKKEPSDQYHAYVCWICAQLGLGSLLGLSGREDACLDVFQSLEESLHNNHLAVGEWNQSIDENLKSKTLPLEPGKDTPRFPPYPRYKCAWEYLIRILGLKMDEQNLFLKPFTTIDFAIREFKLAGTVLTVKVNAGWTKVFVNGKPSPLPVKVDRGVPRCEIEFRK
jgi:uncharacterized protein (DUF608 family)